MPTPKTVYCPRCDKPFTSERSRFEVMRTLDAHIKKAHPEYLPMLED